MELKREKSFAMGVIGAIAGGLIGAASIILLSQMGVISAIAGFVLAFCTLKGFELLGGKLEKNSLIICILIMIAVPYLANHISYAITYCQVYNEEGLELVFGDAFAHLYELIEFTDNTNGNTEVFSAFVKDLVFVYLFTALGAYTMVKQAFKQYKAAEEAAEVQAPAAEYPFEQN